MYLKVLYIRFYKSFNYDYLRKSHPKAEADKWDLLSDGKFYPFVRIPLESDITTVVGANESGKSQTLSAVKCLLTGEGIERKDFCRYSTFFSVGKDMATPEFGGEFAGLTSDEMATIRSIAGLSTEASVDSFCFFRFNKRTTLYVQNGGSWSEHDLKTADIKRIALPTYFEINARIPLPDSVPIDYLVDTRVNKTGKPRKQTLAWYERVRDNLDWFSPEGIAKSSAKITAAFAAASSGESDEHLAARLGLAEDLLIDVAGIDRSAFEELRKAVRQSEGYANGLVAKMNAQLAEALNFPKWWTQDTEFSLYLTLRDFDLVFTVRDRTGSDYSFSERSGGMSYFLSYFVQYLSHVHPGSQEILLMDEPDAYLSTLGQQDLLRIFDSFASPEDTAVPTVQVVYVTHSPFLIDKNHGERIRVLEKGDGEEGTRVVSNAARNHYEPLRSAFGAFVAETTFISNCNLMLEGPADQVLLAGLSSLARRLRRPGESLDLNSLSLVPSGGAEHIPYMVYLATGRDVDRPAVAVLLDSDGEGEKIVAELKRGYRDRKLLDDEFIVQVGSIDPDTVMVDVSSLQETEDLIPAAVAELALKQVAREVLSNSEAQTFIQALPELSIPTGQKVFRAAEMAAKEHTKDAAHEIRLDKVAFARAVLEVIQEQGNESLRDQTLSNFEVLYGLINAAKRAAERKNTRERTSKTMNRLRKNFSKDHPTSATRRDAQTLLEDVLAQLTDTSPEAEKIRDDVRLIRADFLIDSDVALPVSEYETFKQRLEALTYGPVHQVQDSPTI
ncbi:OLD family endonuclease [Arthrobacter echini]|uniref:OLD family endonuclease n=1 Tax=Arthrobacter echini TaxID=1529066 RepID=A0A4V3Z585_9MICC|nr:AAA family ATPase [Arthrobacter echini]THJ65629.1 OLD family endonuclease [Arthrobacter echini]